MSTLDDKVFKLRLIIRSLGRAAVAFSGGSDSALVAKVARQELGEGAVAITLSSSLFPTSELEQAAMLAEEIGIEHLVLRFDPLAREDFVSNPSDRCYLCKLYGYGEILKLAGKRGLGAVVDGTNADDSHDYRPGTRAKDELGVSSPLVEAGIGKDDVRAISEVLGLSTHSRAASACLASRIPYGDRITGEKLTMIEHAEDFLRAEGFGTARVRAHGPVARVEVSRAELGRLVETGLREAVVERLKELGFSYVTLDLEGYRTGSMNEVLPI